MATELEESNTMSANTVTRTMLLKAEQDEANGKTRNVTAEDAQRGIGISPAEKFAAYRNGNLKRRPMIGTLRAFPNTPEGVESAYRFGMWFMAAVGRSAVAFQIGTERGYFTRGQVEYIPQLGGVLVPDELGHEVIHLMNQYGVVRRWGRVWEMGSDTLQVPTARGGLDAKPIGEAAVLTAQDDSWGAIGLHAKKWEIYAKASSEINEDSVVSFGDEMAYLMGHAFAKAEDDACFNGDATSGYNGITGIIPALTELDATPANIAGITVASGDTWAEITLGDVLECLGNVAGYAAENPTTAIFCSRQFYFEVLANLAIDAGGTPVSDIEGLQHRTFLGYPVVFVESMPSATAVSSVCMLFGDLRLASLFGSRRGLSVAQSGHVLFESDQIAIRATSRFDFVAHDIGNASANAADHVSGAIVGLMTAAT